MSRIKQTFAALRRRNEAALVPFIMAGDPDLDVTRALLLEAAEAGADLIELGVPFSDPTADGPVIQRAGLRALAHRTSLRQILELVAELRRGGFTTPIILFGYYNPIFHYGPPRLVEDAQRAGVDGLLVVDLPPDEADELWQPARAAGLRLQQQPRRRPRARSRVRAVVRKASGFVYFVSMTGVTGSKAIDADEVQRMVGELRADCRLPIGVGFGISTPDEAAAVAGYADAVVVGSAIVRLIETNAESPSLVSEVGGFLRAEGRLPPVGGVPPRPRRRHSSAGLQTRVALSSCTRPDSGAPETRAPAGGAAIGRCV
jgi:tryptophan synthase alpha chain